MSRPPDPAAPFLGLVFKTHTDRERGKDSFVRIYSGTMREGMSLVSPRVKGYERVARLFRVHADKRRAIKEASAGDIVLVSGFKQVATGDTVCEGEALQLEGMTFPEPVVSAALEARSAGDEEKIQAALAKLAGDDPTFTVKIDENTGQTVISGMGELHLEVLEQRLTREFGLKIRLGRPQVTYRETISRGGGVRGALRSLHAGQAAVRRGQAASLAAGAQLRGSASRAGCPTAGCRRLMLAAVESALASAKESGILYGYPVVDLKAELVEAQYNEASSTEFAFRVAAQSAFRDGCRRAGPVLLEPVMSLEIVSPREFTGGVLSNLAARHGRVLRTDTREQVQIIRAEAPLSKMFGYATDLRSASQGRATYSMLFSHFEVVADRESVSRLAPRRRRERGQRGGSSGTSHRVGVCELPRRWGICSPAWGRNRSWRGCPGAAAPGLDSRVDRGGARRDPRAATPVGLPARGRAAWTDWCARRVLARAAERSQAGARRVVNATGVLLHTNLGRAPLPASAVRALSEAAGGYSQSGDGPGERPALFAPRAVAAAAAAGHRGRGGDRRPQQRRGGPPRPDGHRGRPGGGRLARALGRDRRQLPAPRDHGRQRRASARGRFHEPHPSLRLRGRFVAGHRAAAQGPPEQLPADRLHGGGADAGSRGARPRARHSRCCTMSAAAPCGAHGELAFGEPTVQEALEDGADLVCFSGDKLLGGPQAGILVGRREWIERLAKHPVARVVRLDKAALAALAGTLEAWLDPGTVRTRIPLLALLARGEEELEETARSLASRLRAVLPPPWDIDTVSARVRGRWRDPARGRASLARGPSGASGARA